MTDKQIIDASQCEWRTGVEHCGDYECMLNKCCDFNCDWYRRRKLEQQLKAKEQECETLKDEVLHLRKEGKKSCAYCADLIAKEQECKELRKDIKDIANLLDLDTGEEYNFDNIEMAIKDIKQECERLKENLPNAITRLMKELDQLKAENIKFTLDSKKLVAQYSAKLERLKQTLTEIKEIAKPYQKEIKKICGNCDNYDDCHACCKFDLNCYQYKKGDTTTCEKFIMPWKYYINELANKILQKISECEVKDE